LPDPSGACLIRRRSLRSRWSLLVLQPSVVATPLALSTAAAAATFRVDRTDDEPAVTACEDAEPNDCSLRGATLRANAAIVVWLIGGSLGRNCPVVGCDVGAR
jgi:hypothetical protein